MAIINLSTKAWIEGKEIKEPRQLATMSRQLNNIIQKRYLKVTENVGFVTETYPLEDGEGKVLHKPKKRCV